MPSVNAFTLPCVVGMQSPAGISGVPGVPTSPPTLYGLMVQYVVLLLAIWQMVSWSW